MNQGTNFLNQKENEIRRYEIENEKNLSPPKIKEIEKNLSKKKKYYDYDEYKGVRDLFDLSVDEDYYKPIMTSGALNNNYIQYESRGNKDKISTIKEYLHMIRPYLSDVINDHKTQGEWRVHSGNTIIKHKIKVNRKFN